MAGKGPPPTPRGILKLRGSWRGKRPPGEPRVAVEAPPCPRWLSEGARRAWRVLAPQLVRAGVLSKVDGNILARYCATWSLWVAALERVERDGPTSPVLNNQGLEIARGQSADFKVVRDLAAELHRAEDRLGLSPSARTRLRALDSEEVADARKLSLIRVDPAEGRA